MKILLSSFKFVMLSGSPRPSARDGRLGVALRHHHMDSVEHGSPHPVLALVRATFSVARETPIIYVSLI